MNNQKPIEQDLSRNGITKAFLINNIFYTLQAGGPFSGQPAVIIQMGGCNLQCSWCDTEYSNNKEMGESEILGTVEQVSILPLDGLLVVITGGEPFSQHISRLCASLISIGCFVQVETNGTLTNYDFPWDGVEVVVSPKTKFLHKDILLYANYWKYVISSDDKRSDLGIPLFSTQKNTDLGAPRYVPARVSCKNIYLAPLNSKNTVQNFENRQTAVILCLKFGYNLSL